MLVDARNGAGGYGADGVQGVVEMLQTELARRMGMCGKSNLKILDRTLLKVYGARQQRITEKLRVLRQRAWPRRSCPWVASWEGPWKAWEGPWEGSTRVGSRRGDAERSAGWGSGRTAAIATDLAAQTDPRPFNDHKRLPGLNEMIARF